MHLGLIGYGSISRALIPLLSTNEISQISVLVRPSARDTAQVPPQLGIPLQFVTSLDTLMSGHPDLVVECAGHAAVAEHAASILAQGTHLLVASVGALAQQSLHDQVTAAAATSGARLIIPTGAIGGLDLLSILAAAGKVDVVYTGTKPPQAWKGTPAEDAAHLNTLDKSTVLFRGTGRAAALAYRKNANVVAALAIAGAGFDDMSVTLVADPQATHNTHAYTVTSPSCSYQIQIENTPTQGNVRTSITTVMSILKDVTHHARTHKD
jgi:aspartate dehydrogenase